MTIQRLTMTVLVDDRPGFGAAFEHGFALWIETDAHRILFDTGQGPTLSTNADSLGIRLDKAQALVISHGHYDHSGGLNRVLNCNRDVHVYCHPGAVVPRYCIRHGRSRPIHMPGTALAALNKVSQRCMHWVNESAYLFDDFGITGPIPRESACEDPGGPFFLDLQGQRPDPVADDIALWIRTTKGLVVCVGCCHAGLVNTLHHVKRLSGESAIRAVIGGFHLLNATPERMSWTVAQLVNIAPAEIIPCHCTGDPAIDALCGAFGDRIRQGHAGLQVTI